ncbi:MerR family transcriptional regulator [bacterium]|nr:MerR family transcriptional regulator [bacterium]
MSGPEIRRLYYSTQDVCDIVHVRPYDLKQWSTKFSELRPSVSKTGRRLYKDKDLEVIRRIKTLKDQGHSDDEIEYLLNHPEIAPLIEKADHSQLSIPMIIQELEAILDLLDSDGPVEEPPAFDDQMLDFD